MVEKVIRECGHAEVYEPRPDYQWETARRRKFFAQRLCCYCRIDAGKKSAAEKDAAYLEKLKAGHVPTGKVKKGSEVKALPVGTVIVLRRQEAGWIGSVADEAQAAPVEAEAAGLMSLINKLARKSLVARGGKVSGKVLD